MKNIEKPSKISKNQKKRTKNIEKPGKNSQKSTKTHKKRQIY